MIIEKIINNNIISSYDDAGTELVIMGRGIGFGTKPGKKVPESKIEKVFEIKSASVANHFLCEEQFKAEAEPEHLCHTYGSY